MNFIFLLRRLCGYYAAIYYKWSLSICWIWDSHGFWLVQLMLSIYVTHLVSYWCKYGIAAAKLLQSCLTLCDPIDGYPPGAPVPGILQARTLEWVAISFSNAWKWSHSVVSYPQWPHGLQLSRLLCPWDFPGKSTEVGCHCLPWKYGIGWL